MNFTANEQAIHRFSTGFPQPMLTGYQRPQTADTAYSRVALVHLHELLPSADHLRQNINFYQVTPNFNLQEFMSPDTGEIRIVPDLVRRLQVLRDVLARPIHISSGYRTPEHNITIGGVPLSPHILGVAADIVVKDVSARVLLQNALQSGLLRVFFYIDSPHVHVDLIEPPLVIVPPGLKDALTPIGAEFGVTTLVEELHQAQGVRGR